MDPMSAIIGFVVFIFSVIVHENAHGVAAEHFGDPTARYAGRITLNPIPHIDPVGSLLMPAFAIFTGFPFIGWARPVPVNPLNLRKPLVHNAYVAAAGPASNFLLALFSAILWIVVQLIFKHNAGLFESGEPTLRFFDTLCYTAIKCNCILAVFNLMPIPPLDGHWILIRFLPPGPREAVASIGRFGFIILMVLLWTNALWWIIRVPYTLAYTSYFSLVRGVVGFF